MGEFLASQAWQLALMGVLLACSAFFSGSETAVFALSRADLLALRHDRRRGGRMVPALMRDPGTVLATVLLGNNLVNILYFVLSTLLILNLERSVVGGAYWAPFAAGLTLLALVLVGEVLPKTLVYLSPARLAPLAAPVLSLLGAVVRPIQRVLTAAIVDPVVRLAPKRRREHGDLTGPELEALLTLSCRRGLLGQDETELLQEVLELTDLRARDIMVPRVDMVAFSADGPAGDLLALAREKAVTEVPLYEEELDNIVGAVRIKRVLMDPSARLRDVLSPVQFIPEAARLERALLQLRATRASMAVVVDEYGGTAGLLTLADIIEEIVGDIARRPWQPQGTPVQQVGPSEWLVAGDLPVHEWAEAFPTDLAGVRFATVGGFVTSLLGHIPAVGETAEYRNVTFTVVSMRRRRVGLLRVRLREGRP